MTACVNRKHTKKVAAVVTASLVGALSLGAAPVAAMAETGIETLALSAQDAFAQGEMTEARDGQNRRLEIPADGIITVEAGKWVVPTEITPKDGDPIDVRDNATIEYNIGGTWTSAVSASDFENAGTYQVRVTKVIDGANAVFETTFIVEDEADLTNATLFDGKGGVSDTTFTYNGKAQDIQVAINGKKLDASKYEIDFYQTLDVNGKPLTGADVDANGFKRVTDVEDAGTYVANIFEPGTGHGATDLQKQITFTVGKLNLTGANVSIADIDEASVANPNNTVTAVTVNGDVFNVSASGLSVVATLPSNSTGKATALVTVANNANITGTATVEFNVVDEVVSDAYYNGAAFSSNRTDANGYHYVDVNLADGESFKPERIQVKNAALDVLDASYFTVSYRDGDGNELDASALSNPGVYYVVVRVNAEASHFAYGSGEITLKVNVQNAQIADKNDIVFKYDGKVGDSFKDTYTGEDFLPQIETIVHTQWGDDLVAGTDYTVQAYKDDEKVDQIVDKGVYTVKIELKGNYGGSISDADLECTFEVEALKLTAGLSVNGGDLTAYTYDKFDHTDWWGNDHYIPTTVWYLGYTGEAIEPAFELGYYTDADGNVVSYSPANADKLTWNALPADAFTATGYQYLDGTWKDVDEVKAKGEYKVKFALESENYDLSASDDENTVNYFTVSTDRVAFADVDPDEWYAESIFQAKQLGYIKGIQGSNLYAPNAAITRADALVIISRMAGADTELTEDWLSQNSGYVTRYNDVDPGAYYAKAVAWATKVGVVHGYGDGTFRPDAQITREEFAAYLANYAQAMGKDVTVDADAVLAEFPDGTQVSDWAEGVVAWAADSDIMGNGGFIAPQSQITRAEVAAMAVNYQPNGINQGVIG